MSDLIPLDDVIEDHKRRDPAFAKEWDRTAFAREVSYRIIAYRTENGMTQTDLAKAVGMTQSVIARLESGEHAPSLATLAKVSRGTGLTFHVDVTLSAVELAAA